jgi:signal recognition particle receptor subunit alpha
MLDSVAVFTKGGTLLWVLSFVSLKGDPINTLIRACLLEERAGQSSFDYVIPSGGTYTLKWSLNNVRWVVQD